MSGTRYRYDASEISRMLAVRMMPLVQELLPGGRREGYEWRVGSVAGEKGQSCAVRLAGENAGLWSDFSTGEGGDALDLVAAVLYRGDLGHAIKWALTWLGLSNDQAPEQQRAYVPPEKTGPDLEQEKKRRNAKAIWLNAKPYLSGTPAAAYLLARGIDLKQLGRQPNSLRYHPGLYNGESRREWPALVAAISNAAGQHVATHRTWLARNSSGVWVKAPLRDAKKSLGSLRGGTIRLWRGQSEKSLNDAPNGESAVIGEGIETCLSVALAVPEFRVLSAVSLANMGSVALPPAISTVIIAADNDHSVEARRGLQRAINWFLSQSREVRVARPSVGKDFNDTLRGWG